MVAAAAAPVAAIEDCGGSGRRWLAVVAVGNKGRQLLKVAARPALEFWASGSENPETFFAGDIF